MKGMCYCEGPGFTNDEGPIPHTPGSPRCETGVPLDPPDLSGLNAYRRLVGLLDEGARLSKPAVVVPTEDLRAVIRLARRTLFLALEADAEQPEGPLVPAPEG